MHHFVTLSACQVIKSTKVSLKLGKGEKSVEIYFNLQTKGDKLSTISFYPTLESMEGQEVAASLPEQIKTQLKVIIPKVVPGAIVTRDDTCVIFNLGEFDLKLELVPGNLDCIINEIGTKLENELFPQ